MSAARVRPSVAILGCGAVGGALAWALARNWTRERRSAELWLWSPHARRMSKLRRRELEGFPVRVLTRPEEALECTRAVLLCVPDAAIVPLANRLARSLPPSRRVRPAVLHTNGLLGAEALVSLKKKGAAVGKLHPFWAANRAYFLPHGVSFGIEGDPRATRVARQIIRWVDGRPIPLRKGSGALYHAAASLLSGGVVALYELADRLLIRAVPALDAERRARALNKLVDSSELNVITWGTRVAITGAVSRGAEDAVRSHLRALRRTPDALEAYRVLGRTMLELGRARGSVDAPTARRLARLLGARARRR